MLWRFQEQRNEKKSENYDGFCVIFSTFSIFGGFSWRRQSGFARGREECGAGGWIEHDNEG